MGNDIDEGKNMTDQERDSRKVEMTPDERIEKLEIQVRALKARLTRNGEGFEDWTIAQFDKLAAGVVRLQEAVGDYEPEPDDEDGMSITQILDSMTRRNTESRLAIDRRLAKLERGMASLRSQGNADRDRVNDLMGLLSRVSALEKAVVTGPALPGPNEVKHMTPDHNLFVCQHPECKAHAKRAFAQVETDPRPKSFLDRRDENEAELSEADMAGRTEVASVANGRVLGDRWSSGPVYAGYGPPVYEGAVEIFNRGVASGMELGKAQMMDQAVRRVEAYMRHSFSRATIDAILDVIRGREVSGD